MPTSSTRISSASKSSCDVTSISPAIVSPRLKLSLLMFSVAEALGALNDLNSGKNIIPLFLAILLLVRAKISCCLRIQIVALD